MGFFGVLMVLLPIWTVGETIWHRDAVFYNEMKVYTFKSTADVESLTFYLKPYSGNPDLYIDTPMGDHLAYWYSRTPREDWVVILPTDRQLTDGKGLQRTFSFGVYGASRTRSRFDLSLTVIRRNNTEGRFMAMEGEEEGREGVAVGWGVLGVVLGVLGVLGGVVWRGKSAEENYVRFG